MTDERLGKAFDVWWPLLKEQLTEIESETSDEAEAPVRTERELLEETLDTVRSLARSTDQIAFRLTVGPNESAWWLLSRALQALPERERQVLELRFGLAGERPKTLEQIGEILGISRERVRQLESQAIRRLEVAREIDRLRGEPE